MFRHIPHLQCQSCTIVTQPDTVWNCWYTGTQENIRKPAANVVFYPVPTVMLFCLLMLLWNIATLLFQWKIAVSALEHVPKYKVRKVYASQQNTRAAVLSCLLISAFHSSLLPCARTGICVVMPWSISEESLCWRQKLIQQTVFLQACAPCDKHRATLKWAGRKAGHLLSTAVTNYKALTHGTRTKQTFSTATVSS